MRQVPRYLIIGNGQVACHFKHYFSLLDVKYSSWDRSQSTENLQQQLTSCSHALILISDRAIEQFIENFLKNTSVICVHFSGSLVSQHAYGAHPLMTFNDQLYNLPQYQAIPFVIDHDAPPFEELLPGLTNQHVRLDKKLKSKYHALCVLSGNFSCLLWKKLFEDFERELNIPAAISHPYLLQQTYNLLATPNTALTGPLVRNDTVTIEKNLLALKEDPFKVVYESFVSCYQSLQKEKS